MDEGIWLSIVDYAEFKGISISTVRRYIKSNRLKVKQEKGKFLIFVSQERYNNQFKKSEENHLSQKLEIESLKMKINKLQEENNDLKMLITMYESEKKTKLPSEGKQTHQELPDIPIN